MSSRPKKWKFRVQYIIEAIERIHSYTGEITYEEFLADPLIRDGVSMNLIIIGEAAKHIPLQVDEKFQDIPWNNMRSMRNFMVHEYDRVDPELVWLTIRNKIPPLLPLLRRVLEEAQEEESDG